MPPGNFEFCQCRTRYYFVIMIPDRSAHLPLLTSLAFAGSFVAAKYTTADLQPLTATLLRYLLALLFLALIVAIKRERIPPVTGSDMGRFALLGLFGIAGYHYFFFASLHYTALANTAIINGCSPVITGLLAAIFIKERLKPLNWLGILISFSGILLLLSKADISVLLNFRFNKGDLLMLAAVVCWAAYALMVKTMGEKHSSLFITFMSALAGVILLLIPAFIEGSVDQIARISSTSLIALFYMGIIASAAGYFLYNISIRKIGPTRTSSFVYSLVPILASLLGFLFFGEPITLILFLSVIIVAIGLHLALHRPRKG